MTGDVPKFSLVKFKTLIRDTRGPADATNEVLHTQEELDEYVASCQDQQKPRHTVAFPEERAVAVALGARAPGGYHVEIIAIVQETGGFVGMQHHVLYVEQVPHGPATETVTYPQHVIRARGLGGIVSFRQVPDWIGHSLRALIGAITGPGHQAPPHPTTLAVGEEDTVTTLAIGEEGQPTAPFGEHPTTLAVGEEANMTTLALGEEGQPTAPFGEHPTTLAVDEEANMTTLATGEETLGHGGGRGPFG